MAQRAGRHDTVGEDLVNHCVNDILVHGARPVAFLDYIAGARVPTDTLAALVDGVARGCRAHGMTLAGGETAELPDLYQPGQYDLAGTKQWTTKLPSAVSRDTRVLGAAGGIVYVLDGDYVRTLDAKTGKLLGSTGVPDTDRFAIHATAPAFTHCAGGSGRSLVALDPSTPAPEHRVKIRGRIRCKNCDSSTQLEVHIGDTAVTLAADRTLSLDVVARGTLSLEVRDASFPASTRIQLVDFHVDRTLTLGDVPVTVPEMGPGED